MARRSKKVRRNELCPCGSGRKFKHCCLDADRKRGERGGEFSWEAEVAAARKAATKGICCAPKGAGEGCGGKIVHAHTVPRSSLSHIADRGHVLSFDANVGALKRHGTAIWPKLRGIGKASVFTGFCAKHDNDLFVPLEEEPFVGTHKQCFLLGYRAVAREMFLKTNIRGHFERRLPEIARQRGVRGGVVKGLELWTMGMRMGEAELGLEKDEYDNILVAGDYGRMNAYVIELCSVPPVMCSGGFVPENTFEGKPLETFGQPPAGRRAEMTMSSFADVEGRGFVVFAWLDDVNGHAAQFVDSLDEIGDAEVSGPLLRFMFEYCENVHIEPAWWEGLSVATRKALVAHMDMASEYDPLSEPRDFYSDDGVEYPAWVVGRRYLVRST